MSVSEYDQHRTRDIETGATSEGRAKGKSRDVLFVADLYLRALIGLDVGGVADLQRLRLFC